MQNKHLLTKSHKEREENKSSLFTCKCGKAFKYFPGLSRHKKTCNYIPETENEPEIEYTEVQSLKKENNEMKEIINKKEEEIKEIINKKDEEIREMNYKIFSPYNILTCTMISHGLQNIIITISRLSHFIHQS